MGMYSFGLCETNMFAQAEKVARKVSAFLGIYFFKNQVLI